MQTASFARAGRSFAPLGAALSGNVSVTYQRNSLFATTGFGLIRLTETHKLAAPGLFGYYKNVRLPVEYFFVPVHIGYSKPLSKNWSLQTIIGVNLLVERHLLKGGMDKYFDYHELETKKDSEYQGKYAMYQLDLANSGITATIGSRLSHQIRRNIMIDYGIEFNLGLSVLSSNLVSVEEDRLGASIISSAGSMKGDAIRATLGLRYALFRP